MGVVKQFEELIQIQKNNSHELLGQLNSPISDKQIEQIETLAGEQLPEDFKQLYKYANGQEFNTKGVLLGDEFVSAQEIIQHLEWSRNLIKPEVKTIPHPEKSESLIKQIVDFYISKAPKHKLFGLQKSWYKIQFSCAVGSYEGPYSYQHERTTSQDRKYFKIDDYKEVAAIIKQLHELEKPIYNWDELKFIVYADGKYEVERSCADFDDLIRLTSTPKNAINANYVNYQKWIPIFSDGAGNYLGIDLIPGIKGKKGQIINFGRDKEEQDMIVFADSLSDFFEFIKTELEKPDNKLMNLELHLHDTLKNLKKE